MVFSAMPLLEPRVLHGLPPLPPISSSRAKYSIKKTLTHTRTHNNNTSFLFSRGAGVVVYFVSLVLLSTKAGSGCPRELPRLRREGPRRSGPTPSPWRRQTDPGGLSPGGKSHHFSLSLSLSLSLCLPSVLRLVLTEFVPSLNCGRLCRDVFAGLTAGVAGLGASGAAHAANAKELAAKAEQRKKEMRARMEALRAEEANNQAEAAKAAAAAQAAKEAAASAAAAAPPQEG